MTSSAVERERVWHDSHYAGYQHPATLAEFLAKHRAVLEQPYWATLDPAALWGESLQHALRLARPSGNWRDVRVLDAGCGHGFLALWLASKGADVDAFDLSGVATTTGANAARRYGLADHCRIVQGDANVLAYQSASFDVIVGGGVLHHLVKYPSAAAELARVLKPQGIGAFSESWWENPILNAMRRRFTLFDDDAGDDALTYRTLTRWCGQQFRITVHHRSLLYAAKRATRFRGGGPIARQGLHVAQMADRALLRIPGLRRMAAEAVVALHHR